MFCVHNALLPWPELLVDKCGVFSNTVFLSHPVCGVGDGCR